MSDLISRSAYIKTIDEYLKNAFDCSIDEIVEYQKINESKASYIVEGFAGALELLEDEPTVEANPVVRGEWLGCDMKTSICSECRTEFDINRSVAIKILNFCPNCGADMGKKVG